MDTPNNTHLFKLSTLVPFQLHRKVFSIVADVKKGTDGITEDNLGFYVILLLSVSTCNLGTPNCAVRICIVDLKKLAQVHFKVSSNSNQLILESNIHSLKEISSEDPIQRPRSTASPEIWAWRLPTRRRHHFELFSTAGCSLRRPTAGCILFSFDLKSNDDVVA